jgi:hypothetical protein
MRMVKRALAALAIAAVATAPAGAEQPPQPRILEVPARNSWQHAETQLILPPQIAGLARYEIKDLGEEEMDVVAEYRGPYGLFATVFLFRTAVPDTALWFDRAATMISQLPAYGLAGAPLPAPTPFTRPGAAAASGLRVTVDLAGGTLRSTGLAVAPLGDYLLKIRISSERLDRGGLDALLGNFIDGVRWPAPPAGERAAAPIEPCPEPLRLRNARVLRPDMGESLMDALTGSLEPEEGAPLVVFCREPGANLQYGVYRPGASRRAYLIALNDAGIVVSLGEGLNLGDITGEGGGRSRVAMTLLGRNSTSVLSSFNRLPPPAQALSVAFSGRGPGISVITRD